MNILFLCGGNKKRSITAEEIFSSYEEIECRSAGVNNNAEHIVDSDDIDWADLIFVMESNHKNKLNEKWNKELKQKKVIVLNISDKYEYMDKELIKLLNLKVKPFLK